MGNHAGWVRNRKMALVHTHRSQTALRTLRQDLCGPCSSGQWEEKQVFMEFPWTGAGRRVLQSCFVPTLFLVLACTSFLPSKCYIWLCDVLVRVEHVPLLPNLFLGTSPAAGRVGLTNVGGRSG